MKVILGSLLVCLILVGCSRFVSSYRNTWVFAGSDGRQERGLTDINPHWTLSDSQLPWSNAIARANGVLTLSGPGFSGPIMTVPYVDGKRNGTWTNWWQNGYVRLCIPFERGHAVSFGTGWWPNGQKEREYDAKEMRLTCWDQTGRKYADGCWKEGKEWNGTFASWRQDHDPGLWIHSYSNGVFLGMTKATNQIENPY